MEEEKAGIFEIISTVIKIICVILLIFLILVVGFQRFSNNQKGIGGFRVFNVATGSMVPTYKVGDIIIPVSYTDVTGDVVFECIDAENNRYLKYTLDNESVYTKSYTKIAVSEEEVQAMIDGAFEEEIDFIDYTIDP